MCIKRHISELDEYGGYSASAEMIFFQSAWKKVLKRIFDDEDRMFGQIRINFRCGIRRPVGYNGPDTVEYEWHVKRDMLRYEEHRSFGDLIHHFNEIIGPFRERQPPVPVRNLPQLASGRALIRYK